ncbi:IS21 family transposase [Roseateles oligotrophus]|uniref:IS21 family transposase n=1 Tax=Roseateles oligotrophus TaxID=1769250 RepID=A0ABT2YG95_9BURK|nr:IS21 family transposase [Roseateles oligotrophus]MCV2369075.1 IS21 family transposase [Roseateles oligotrophus]
MTIAPDLAAQILRLHNAEKWRVGTIARQLHVHRDTVRRVLAASGSPVPPSAQRPSRIDAYRPFIMETLIKFPTLTAARVYAMVSERGYVGSESHFRHLIAELRPGPAAEAYLRLLTLPGEQAQVDWGHFGHLQIGRAKRPLMAFVMVLSYSRRIFLRFFLDARMDAFLRGHVEAFAAFGGVARVLLYDNLKSAVLERVGDAIRFNPVLLKFAAHHLYEPRPVAVARGNEKGRVERSIRYVRDNFFAAREFTDLADLNAQARTWCEGQASKRRWPQDTSFSVQQAFEGERAHLLPLPVHDYAVGERLTVVIGKTPYARFDLNDYSVPHTHVRRTVSVLADEQCVRILDGTQELAVHVRSWDKAAQIENPVHIQTLVECKHKARAHRACDRLSAAVPASTELLRRAAERGHNLGSITASLLRLLERYSAAALQAAMLEALAANVPHPNAVRHALERAAQADGQPPPTALILPEHVARRDAPVRPHKLDSYDRKESDDET